MFHSDLFGRLFGPPAPNASGLGGAFADPRMDPRKALPAGLVAGPVDDRMLSPEEKLDKYLQKLQAAKKREELFKMAGLIQGMGQSPSFAPPAPAATIGAGRPGVSRSGGPDPGQQLKGMLGKAGGIGMPGAPMGYPGGVPGAAAGGGPSLAHMLQQLAMKRMGRPRLYAGIAGGRF